MLGWTDRQELHNRGVRKMTFNYGRSLDYVTMEAYETALAFIQSYHRVGEGISEEDYQQLIGYIQKCIKRREARM